VSRTVILSWSTGKDAAWTLHLLRQQDRQVAALLTTVTRTFDRVAIHGVRRSVARQQAARAGLPLVEVELPWPCSNEMYEFAISAALHDLAGRTGAGAVAFGDLFLEDVRAYRERLLRPLGLTAEFPLWGMRTDLLAERMLRAGIAGRVASLDPTKLDRSLAGAAWDERFVLDLPSSVDPCGERGEFHTVVTAGPMFSEPCALVPGKVVERDGFVYADFRLEAEPA